MLDERRCTADLKAGTSRDHKGPRKCVVSCDSRQSLKDRAASDLPKVLNLQVTANPLTGTRFVSSSWRSEGKSHQLECREKTLGIPSSYSSPLDLFEHCFCSHFYLLIVRCRRVSFLSPETSTPGNYSVIHCLAPCLQTLPNYLFRAELFEPDKTNIWP